VGYSQFTSQAAGINGYEYDRCDHNVILMCAVCVCVTRAGSHTTVQGCDNFHICTSAYQMYWSELVRGRVIGCLLIQQL